MSNWAINVVMPDLGEMETTRFLYGTKKIVLNDCKFVNKDQTILANIAYKKSK